MANRFVLDPRALRALARSVELQRGLVSIAEQVAQRARELAPYERIRDQIRVEVGATPQGAIARIDSNDLISGFWEFGTINNPARPFMRPASEQADGFTQGTR